MRVPEILGTKMLATTRLFRIEEVHLRFSNGVERIYERMPGFGRPAVMVVAVNDADEVMLIREYAAGFHENQLTLPKGAAERGESLEQAANRELKEEVGLGARRIEWLKSLNLSPGHMGFTINVMLARDLYPERLPADEPELPEVVPWPLARVADLIERPDFAEARALAALYLVSLHLGRIPA